MKYNGMKNPPEDRRSQGESSGIIRKALIIQSALVLLILLSHLPMSEQMSQLMNNDLAMSEKISGLKNQGSHGTICTPCPSGWNRIGCSCYFASEEKTTWEEARCKCAHMKSVLVMVKDKAEADILNQLYKENRRYWIGLRRDPNAINTWKWLDGSKLTVTNWRPNQPDNFHNREHCGESQSGPWNDIHCTDQLYFICKK
ncbi:CD209 antigen-like protein E isoform X2 [Dendropsophus ebraccatus]|uniref:CD209 antigen-like protein E isoform X2 n=1 Tax=Dendropsophus ebraccatus TaxID=150705 RepID=UPI003830FFCC